MAWEKRERERSDDWRWGNDNFYVQKKKVSTRSKSRSFKNSNYDDAKEMINVKIILRNLLLLIIKP